MKTRLLRFGLIVIAIITALAAWRIGQTSVELRLRRTRRLAIRGELQTACIRARAHLNEVSRNRSAAQQPARTEAERGGKPGQRGLAPIRVMMDDPELQIAQLAARKAHFTIAFGPFYRARALTDQQIDAFERALARREEQQTDLYHSRVSQGLPYDDPAIVKLNTDLRNEFSATVTALIGEDGYKALYDYERLYAAREVAGGMIGAAASGGAALDRGQADQLVTALAASCPQYTSGGWVDPAKIDWRRFRETAGQFLTGTQLDMIETIEARGLAGFGSRFMTQLHAAISEAERAEKQAAASN